MVDVVGKEVKDCSYDDGFDKIFKWLCLATGIAFSFFISVVSYVHFSWKTGEKKMVIVITMMMTFGVVGIATDVTSDYLRLLLHTACVKEIPKR